MQAPPEELSANPGGTTQDTAISECTSSNMGMAPLPMTVPMHLERARGSRSGPRAGDVRCQGSCRARRRSAMVNESSRRAVMSAISSRHVSNFVVTRSPCIPR